MSTKGMTISCSMVENDGEYQLGFKYQDTNDIEFDEVYEGNDLEEILEDLANDATQSIIEQLAAAQEGEEKEEKSEEEVEKDEYTLQLEKLIEELKAENRSLKTDVAILQRRADDAVKRSFETPVRKEAKKNSPSTFEEALMRLLYS